MVSLNAEINLRHCINVFNRDFRTTDIKCFTVFHQYKELHLKKFHPLRLEYILNGKPSLTNNSHFLLFSGHLSRGLKGFFSKQSFVLVTGNSPFYPSMAVVETHLGICCFFCCLFVLLSNLCTVSMILALENYLPY